MSGRLRDRALLGGLFRRWMADGAIVEELVLAAREHSPAVAALPPSETRRHVEFLLAAGLRFFEHPEEPDDGLFDAARALGADRAAQGISVDGLLRGVQAGRTRAIAVLADRARDAGVPAETILECLVELDRYSGALERHVVNGYHDAQRRRVRAETHLLRRLLTGGSVPDAAELRRAGLEPDKRYHCVVTDVTQPDNAPALEQRLPACGGVYGFVDGRLAGLAARMPTDEDVPPGALLVAGPAVAWSGLADVHALCVTALRVSEGTTGVRPLVAMAGEIALSAQPALAALLRADYAALDPGDGFHRELVATAAVYLDHGQRLGPAAAALHVHPNTVRYRLDRLARLTGVACDEPGSTVLDTLGRWWAMRAWLADGPVS